METGENEMQSHVILLQIVLYLHTPSHFRPTHHITHTNTFTPLRILRMNFSL